ncbi:MAG TPA: YebC/PmpR family DNA-binding transcriptional regulator [Candidatus Paceibacterota bacterium]
MSGHNKWSKIKNRKAVTDAQKSKIFSKYARLIAAESKGVGGDVGSPTLLAVIERARGENMPNDNIERAIKKGAGSDSENLEEVVYETYGPGGAAILIEALTDNRNRTAQEIKHVLSEQGFVLATPGSASWAFQKAPGGFEATTPIFLPSVEQALLEKLIDVLGELDDVQEIYTNASD